MVVICNLWCPCMYKQCPIKIIFSSATIFSMVTIIFTFNTRVLSYSNIQYYLYLKYTVHVPSPQNKSSFTNNYNDLLSLSCRLSFVNFIVLLGYVLFRQFTNNTYFLHVNIKAAVDRATKMYWIKKETGEEIAMTRLSSSAS